MKRYKNGKKNNYIKKGIFLIILLILINIFQEYQVNGQTTPDIIIESNKQTLNKEEQLEITINLDATKISAYTIYLYYDTNKLEYISSPENSNYINNFVVHTGVKAPGVEESIQITPFTFKTIGTNGITSVILTGEYYNKNGEKIDIEDKMLELQIGEKANKLAEQSDENVEDLNEIQTNQNVSSDNTNLKILRLDKVGITPSFSPKIKEYYFTANADTNNLEVTAIPENSKSNVTVTGNENLKIGLNTIKITVQSEDKTKTSTYVINVTKASDIQKANTNLENLAVREGTLTPEFDNNITQYRVEISNEIDNIDILAVPESMNATVEIQKIDKLEIGDNKITVTVAAEDRITKKKYEIIAHRRTAEEETEYKEEQEKRTRDFSKYYTK